MAATPERWGVEFRSSEQALGAVVELRHASLGLTLGPNSRVLKTPAWGAERLLLALQALPMEFLAFSVIAEQ